VAKKKHYEPPPFGLWGHTLGKVAKKLGVGSAGKATKTPDSTPTPPLVKEKPKPKKPKKLRIEVFPYHDPHTHKEDPHLVALKVAKHRATTGEFFNKLKELGIGLAVGHPKIVTGYAAHVAVVPQAEAKAAAKQTPGILFHGKVPKKPEKWTSAGCVVIDSMDDHDHIYVIKPSNHYGPWSFPKGRVDKGESFKQAAIREVWEETGLHVKILPGKGAYIGKGVGGFSITHFFLAVKTGGHPRPTDETERTSLVTWDEAKRLFRSGGNKRDPHIADLARQALKLYKK
jgi:8-oxo-dGTP diphosphatase